MSAEPELLVAGVGLWLPGVPNIAAWESGARGNAERSTEFEPASGASIERRARRRASPLARSLANSYSEAATAAGIDIEQASSVFGSGLGEVSTMLGLLDQMSRNEELSPMAFATSVHSAASGVVSISAKNRGFSTAISAYHDTVSSALFEAIGLLGSLGQPVVVACGDENSPDRFVEGEEAFDTVTAAIALVPADTDAPILARLRGPVHETPTLPSADVPAAMGRNPQVGLVDLISAVLAKTPGIVSLDRGRGTGWSVELLGG